MAQGHYEILHVDPGASLGEIHAAYRREANHWHPDRNKALNAGEMMALVNLAWEALREASSRRDYDKTRAFAAPPGPRPRPTPTRTPPRPAPRNGWSTPPPGPLAPRPAPQPSTFETARREAAQNANAASFKQAEAAKKAAGDVWNAEKARRKAEQETKKASFLKARAAEAAEKARAEEAARPATIIFDGHYSLSEARKMSRYLKELNMYARGNSALLKRVTSNYIEGGIISDWMTQREGKPEEKTLSVARDAMRRDDLLGAAAALISLGVKSP